MLSFAVWFLFLFGWFLCDKMSVLLLKNRKELCSEWVSATSERLAATSEWLYATSEWVSATSEWVSATSEWVEATSEWLEVTSEWVAATSEWVAATSEWVEATSVWLSACAELVCFAGTACLSMKTAKQVGMTFCTCFMFGCPVTILLYGLPYQSQSTVRVRPGLLPPARCRWEIVFYKWNYESRILW